MKIGFIGFGEAAYYISIGLREEETACGICAYDTMMNHGEMGPFVRSRAKEANVELLDAPKEVVSQGDVIIAAVPPNYTLDACKSVADYLKPGQIYADVSASTPNTKKKIWDILEHKGILFADAAMLGSLPLDKHKVPISVSGSGAQAFFEALSPMGMQITVINERAGDASAIKLIRSIFMKGIAALMVETTQAGMHYGVAEQVVASIGKSLDGIPFEEHFTFQIVGSAIHAKRRGSEVAGSVEMCGEAGVPHDLSDGTVLCFKRLSEYNLGVKYSANRPKNWREVISDINSIKARTENLVKI